VVDSKEVVYHLADREPTFLSGTLAKQVLRELLR
jgi:hypothetical protein